MNIKIKAQRITSTLLILATMITTASCTAQAAKESVPDIGGDTDTVSDAGTLNIESTDTDALVTDYAETFTLDTETEPDEITPFETEPEQPEAETETVAETETKSETEAKIEPEAETTEVPETTKTPETTKASETTKALETTKAPETTKGPETIKAPETIGDPANWTSTYVGTAEQEEKARKVAKQIADSIGPGTDLERIQKATRIVYGYYCDQREDKNIYMTAYSVFFMEESCCWGYTSALGMVLDYMGYSWRRGNVGTDKTVSGDSSYLGSKHQWVIVNDMDGHVGYADAQAGFAYYGAYGGSYDYTFSKSHGDSVKETVITAATCTENGRASYSCSVCGESLEYTVYALGHDSVAVKVVDATEAEQGYTVYTCSRCGETYNDDYTYTTKTCERNGFAHTMVKAGADAKTVTCSVCGFTRNVYTYKECEANGGHYWTLDPINRDADCVVCGWGFDMNFESMKETCYIPVSRGEHYWMRANNYWSDCEYMYCYYCNIIELADNSLIHDIEPV